MGKKNDCQGHPVNVGAALQIYDLNRPPIMPKSKKARGLRHALRWLVQGLLLILLYNIAVGYLPFSRTPKLEDPAVLEARAVEMSRDIDTADRAMILETRTQALDERLRLIAQAKREIIITTYDCRDGESTRDILCAALAKADDGVKVRLLIDGIAGRLLTFNETFRAFAAHPNVEVRFYNVLQPFAAWKHMGRMHDKYVIVDDLGYILGGRNMFDYFLGEYPAPTHSHDREALVYNGAHSTSGSTASSLFQVREYFEGVWALDVTTIFTPRIDPARQAEIWNQLNARYERLRAEKPELFAPADYNALTAPTQGIWLVANPTGIYAKQPVVFNQLCALMRQARRGIVIHSPYVVLNADMAEALSEIAARVPVTLMVNAVENGQNVVASGDYLYHKSEVLATGVQVLEYAGGDSYHGKSLAIDDNIAIIGSFNLDLRSTYVDTELMLVIRSGAINAQLRENMAALHADCQRVISLDETIVPQGLTIPEMPAVKRVALRLLGGVMQLVRNLV